MLSPKQSKDLQLLEWIREDPDIDWLLKHISREAGTEARVGSRREYLFNKLWHLLAPPA